MKGKKLLGALVLLAASLAANAGVQENPEQDEFFKDIKEFKTVKIGDYVARIPILYYDVDSFIAIYSADADKVSAALPSPRLKPIKIGPHRAGLVLGYNDTQASSIGAYREFLIGIPCTCRHEGKTIFGIYIYKMPLTSDIARVGGIEYWGFPKFMADIDATENDRNISLKIKEGSREILDMELGKKGAMPWSTPGSLGVFTIKDGHIIYTKGIGKAKGKIRLGGHSKIKSGPHQMGVELAEFKLGKSPLAIIFLQDVKSSLPFGQDIGPR